MSVPHINAAAAMQSYSSLFVCRCFVFFILFFESSISAKAMFDMFF